MSKSILQEVATFNAEMFNEAKLKADITGVKQDVQAYYESNTTAMHDLQSSYKIVVADLLEETTTTNETLKAEVLKNKIDLAALEKFCIDEIAKYFYNAGAIRKEYRRNHNKVNETFGLQHLQKLELFKGPRKDPIYDSENNWDGVSYTAEALETAWAWMYVDQKMLKYAGHPLLTLDATNTKITIGDSSYNQVILPGTLDLAGDFTISNGAISVTSPLVTDDSITVNGNIRSTGGFLKVQLGVETTSGDIKTSSGNLITAAGGVQATTDITTSGGNITAPAGNMVASTGYTTNTVGFNCTTSGSFTTPSGNISTGAGSVSATTGLTTTTGNISITAATALDGNFTTNNGDFITSAGDFDTTAGNFHSASGNLLLDAGYATLSAGNLTLSNGNLSVTGATTLAGNVTVNTGDVTLASGSDLTLSGGNVSVNGTLDMTGRFYSTYIGALASQFDGKLVVGQKLTALGGLDLTGTLGVTDNLTVGGTLAVTGLTTFSSDVNAGTNTITAAIFDGVATSAQYADLAELYESDMDYPAGTVVSIGMDTEITLYNEMLPLAGVISTDPAYLMNKKPGTEKYLPVALKGRIPVFTDQFITRGMYVFPDKYNPGKCIGVHKNQLVDFSLDYDKNDLIGIAINNTENGMVEVKV